MYLKDFRINMKLSQRKLASILNIAQASIARYESKNEPSNPTSAVITKYIDKLDANPIFLFTGKGSITLSDVIDVSSDNSKLLTDAISTFGEEELFNKIKILLIDEILTRLDYNSGKENIFFKILSYVKLDKEFRCRPFLFLYYIFQMIKINLLSSENIIIENYQEYLIKMINDFNVYDTRNQPIFTKFTKTEIIKLIKFKTTESDCEFLIKNYSYALDALELNMPIDLIKHHRDIFK